MRWALQQDAGPGQDAADGPEAACSIGTAGREGGPMHILALSLFVAIVVCVALLLGFWLLTITPLGRRIEEHERLHGPPSN
jgi:hypothetical protein